MSQVVVLPSIDEIYLDVAKCAKKAHKEGTTLKEATVSLGFLTFSETGCPMVVLVAKILCPTHYWDTLYIAENTLRVQQHQVD